MRMTRIRKRKAKFKGYIIDLNILLFALVLATFSIGVVLGVFVLNNISDIEFGQLFAVWDSFVNGKVEIPFFESFFKYGKFIFAVWLCGFFTYGFVGVFCITLTKGISLGFSSAFIIVAMGDSAVAYISKMYFFQNFVVIFLFVIAGVYGAKTSLEKKIKNKNSISKRYCLFGVALMLATTVISLLYLL